MAEVFLAKKIGAEGFARTVAIKTILAHGTEEEGIGLFLDEARVAALLNHAAIVQTFDLGYENETLFIVMEYVQGPALSRILRELKKKGRFLSPEIVAYTGARVASALGYGFGRAAAQDGNALHLVHRDISPQNILLTRGGMVKLSDFGVARASIQTHRTRTGQVRGKAAYMAPEQVRAKSLDGRTDIFALGVVLYEALTNTRAYQRKTDIQSMRAILTDEVKPIESLNPSVPQSLIAVIQRAIMKSPDARFANANEMEAALEQTYRHKPSSAIEQEISLLIEELFGPAQTSGDPGSLPVEAWQPAPETGNGGIELPRKLPGKDLSPELAEMLRDPPSAPAVSIRDHELARHLGMPLPVPENLEPSGLSAPGARPQTKATLPNAAATGGGASAESRPFTDYSLAPSAVTTPSSSGRSLLRLGIPVLVLLVGVLAALGLGVFRVEQAPSPKAPALAEHAPSAVRAAPAADVTEPADRAPNPGPAAAAARATDRAPSERVSERAPTKRVIAPAERAPAPPPPPVEEPADALSDADRFKKRVLDIARRLESEGDADRAKQLKSLLLSLSMRPPTDADRTLLADAEKSLKP